MPEPEHYVTEAEARLAEFDESNDAPRTLRAIYVVSRASADALVAIALELRAIRETLVEFADDED